MRLGKSDEERAAERAAEEAAAHAREERERRQAWEASPVGKSVAARESGSGFFEIQLQVGLSRRGVGWGSPDWERERSTTAHTDVLSAIEAEGWHLEHAGYFFMQTGEASADRFLGTGQNIAVSGVTMGAYLFRRDDTYRITQVEDSVPASNAPP
jgi:hypothetical protein